MSLILIISIAIRLVAMVLSVVLWRRARDWRMGFLTLMLALMTVRQTLTLASERDHRVVDVTGQAAEVPGLAVSALAMLAVLFLSRFLRDRKRDEETAIESSAKLSALADEQRFLLENMRDFVYRHDTEGVFHYLSPAVEQVTGYTVEEWMKHFTTYMTDHPDNAKVIENTDYTIRTGQAVPPYFVEIFHKNGSRITLEVGERPYFDNGEVSGIVGVARDITG